MTSTSAFVRDLRLSASIEGRCSYVPAFFREGRDSQNIDPPLVPEAWTCVYVTPPASKPVVVGVLWNTCPRITAAQLRIVQL